MVIDRIMIQIKKENYIHNQQREAFTLIYCKNFRGGLHLY